MKFNFESTKLWQDIQKSIKGNPGAKLFKKYARENIRRASRKSRLKNMRRSN